MMTSQMPDSLRFSKITDFLAADCFSLDNSVFDLYCIHV